MYIDQLVARMQEQKYLYMLEHKIKFGFFLSDFSLSDNEKDSAAIWFPCQKIAVKFSTEQSVEEFKATYMSPRPVTIIRVLASEI